MTTFLHKKIKTNVLDQDLLRLINLVNKDEERYVVIMRSWESYRYFRKHLHVEYSVYYRYNPDFIEDVQVISLPSSSYNSVYSYFLGLLGK